MIRFKLDRLLDNLLFSRQQAHQTTAQVHRFCRDDQELSFNSKLLMSVPGIGRIIVPSLMARIGDWRLIQNVRQLSDFFGLVPCEASTGDTVNRGRITHKGDRRMRAKLIQAAWVAIRHDAELDEFYRRIYRRNPKPIAAQKAITAVANKLCRQIACVLKEQRPYVVRKIFPTAQKEETAVPQGTSRTPAETSPQVAA